MAYFRGDDGKLYYPFGKGGQEVLLQTLQRIQSSSNTMEDIKKDIEGSQYFTLPLCSEGAGMKVVEGSSTTHPLEAPLVISCPNIESAKVFHNLADGIISQIFKIQVESQLVGTSSIRLFRFICCLF
jgi:hypothetical protein